MFPQENMNERTNVSDDEDIIIIHLVCLAYGEEQRNTGQDVTAVGCRLSLRQSKIHEIVQAQKNVLL